MYCLRLFIVILQELDLHCLLQCILLFFVVFIETYVYTMFCLDWLLCG